MKVMTWNIAAINNNPFEYWITPPNNRVGESYEKLMKDVEKFILSPGANDVPVGRVFTQDMFEELKDQMKAVQWEGIEETTRIWDKDLSQRRIVSQFICDATIGKKRLISMPDRMTNTIGTRDVGNVCRPTLINCYEGTLGSVSEWWSRWRTFVFDPKGLNLPKRNKKIDDDGETSTPVWRLFQKIKRSKYPALSEKEERISVPLQTLCLAIFDAVLVHMINTIAPLRVWHPIKLQMSKALNAEKNERTVQILETAYGDHDVIFLQEVSSMFLLTANKSSALSKAFHVVTPPVMNARDQNSIVLMRKSRFELDESSADMTDLVLRAIRSENGSDVPVGNGDLVAVRVKERETATPVLLCSFHGDTNGLASVPIVRAVHRVALDKNLSILMGLDANTYRSTSTTSKRQGVAEFCEVLDKLALGTCWASSTTIPSTTFNGRTFLQPQLNKSVRSADMDRARVDETYEGAEWIDRNPKDFILFNEKDRRVLSSSATQRDNTGKGPHVTAYRPKDPFPTLEFPSDHAVVSTVLVAACDEDEKPSSTL